MKMLGQGQTSMPATIHVERKNEDLEDDVPGQKGHINMATLRSPGKS